MSVACSASSKCEILTEQLRAIGIKFLMLCKPCEGDQLHPSLL